MDTELSQTRAAGRPTPSRRRRGFTLIEVVVVMVVMSVALGIFASTVVAGAQQRAVNREKALAADAARAVMERMRNEPFAQVFQLYNGLPEDDPGGSGTAPGHRFAVTGLTPSSTSPDGLHGEVIFPTVEQAAALGVAPSGPPTLTDEELDGTVELKIGDIELSLLGGGGGPGGQLLEGLLGLGEETQATTQNDTREVPPASDPGWILREDVDIPWLGMPRDLNGDNIVDSEDHRSDYILLPVCVRISWNGRSGERTFDLTTTLTDFTR